MAVPGFQEMFLPFLRFLTDGRERTAAELRDSIESGVLDAVAFQAIVVRHGLTGPWEKFRQQFLTEP
jgi:hypothetical protein